MADLRVLMDRLEQHARTGTAGSGPSSTASTPPPLVPGLRFPPQTNVIDVTSGRRGVVKYGVRDEKNGSELYRVELVPGQQVTRTGDELAIDKLPSVR